MKIILKSFYNKKNTKIYMIILLIIMMLCMFLLTYKKYNEELLNDKALLNLNMTLITNVDVKHNLENNSNIKSFIQLLSFDQDYDCHLLDFQTTVNVTKDNYNGENINNKTKILWDYIIDTNTESYIVISDDESNIKLKDNEIALPINVYTKPLIENLHLLKNNNISFKYKENTYSFIIKDFFESNGESLIISSTLFNKLIDNQYVYKIRAKSYSEITKTYNEIKQDLANEIINFDYNEYETEEIRLLKKIIDKIESLIYIMYMIFVIIIIVIVVNLISDERQTIDIQLKIGFRRDRVIVNELIKVLSLFVVIYIVSSLLYVLTIVIINSALNLNILFINIKSDLIFLIVYIIISFYEIIMHIKK